MATKYESEIPTGLAAWREQANALFLLEFAKSRSVFELPAPPPRATPYCWKWVDVHPLMLKTLEVSVEQSFRRSLMFSNPGLYPQPFLTPALNGACSLYLPGEVAPVHRHTPSASRFGLQGIGGFTTVDGEKCAMTRGDLILTPRGAWHDLGNDGDEPIFFLDIVNDPLVLALGGTFYDVDYTELNSAAPTAPPLRRKAQTVREPLGHSAKLYGTGGLVPRFEAHYQPRRRDNPMFVYRWERTLETLNHLRLYDGSLYDGIILEYVNPTTGEAAMPTMSFFAQLLRPGERTLSHRHTSGTVYCVIEGTGFTQVKDIRLEWTRNDVFVVPGWMWHEHANDSDDEDALLYSVSDAAALRKLGLYREQGHTRDGDIVSIAENW
jgi:gentisate 1,2-dioxygenase